VPAPQAVPLLRQPCAGLADLAGRAVMRGCWAVMARFAAPLQLAFDAAAIDHGPLAWAARDSSKPGRGGAETWILHAGADWSEAHFEENAETVSTALLQAFGEIGAPAPQAATAHRWRYARAEPPLNEGCAWHADSGLGLCGDWLNHGTVEGAWLSGRRLAQQVLQSARIHSTQSNHQSS
jgi:renalase